MSLMLNRVKNQSEGTSWADKAHAAAINKGDSPKEVDNAGKFYKTNPVSLNGDFGVMPLKKKLNVEIK